MIVLGIIGALWLIVSRPGRLRLLGVAHIVATALYFLVALSVVRFAPSYQGPSPVYFETCFWAYSLLFCAVVILGVARLALHRLRAWHFGPAQWLARHGALGGIFLTLLLVSGADASLRSRHHDECMQIARFSPTPTPITELLRNKIGLRPGAPFRGLAATIDGVGGRASVGWFDFHGYDGQLWQKTGNDHRVDGLWKFGIPTLFQYFTLITPTYYLMLSEFLARPADVQMRSVLVLSQINAAMMQLWGVRFVITDTASTAGPEVAAIQPAGMPKLRLIELPDPNLGNYSPTEVEKAADFPAGLRLMHAPGFDGRRTVVVDEPLSGPFQQATNSTLVYEKYGFHVTADSSGQSIVVLPVQYSHCWRTGSDPQVHLFRANIMQLGLAFSGHLDARLVFHYGPVLAGECKVKDLHDMERLKITDARTRLSPRQAQ